MLRTLRYILEAALISACYLFFRLLPLDIASGFAGALARMIGPFLRVHRTARTNLEMVMPELSEQERGKILGDMWENLGRAIGEYPHLSHPDMATRITIEGKEHLEAVKASGKGSLFVSGHFANWEIGPLTASIYGLPLVLIYRVANNPFSNWLIQRIRTRYSVRMHGKGREGAQEAIKALKNHQAVGILVDQKMNDGSPVPFFGRDAMTATATAQLAIKFQVPILAARVVRTDGAHFHVTVMPPVQYDTSVSPEEVMKNLHHIFEGWIREHPAQWFWVHNRWNTGA